MTVETDLVNQFSGFPQLETSIGTAFLLVCLCLACLTTMLHQIVSEASAAAKNRTSNVRWPPPRFLAVPPLGGSRRFPLFAVSSSCCRRRILNDNERQHKETIQTQCNSPYDTAICYFHIAIWLGRCQPVLVQFDRTSEPDAVRHSVSPLSPTTCWLAGPEFLGWPLIQPGGQVQGDLAPLREDSYVNIPGCALPGPPHQRWRRDAPQPLEILQPRQGMDTRVHIPEGGLRCVSWNTRRLLGSTASSQVSREQKQKHLQRVTEKNDIVCLQESHGQVFFFFCKPVKYYTLNFGCLAPSFQKT